MFAQTDRPLSLTTPLGADKFLLLGFQGREAVSELFRFELQAAWQDTKAPLEFDKLLGQKITIQILSLQNKRYINGMVSRITQGHRDDNFIYYVLEVVPELWLLDRKLRSRIFQQITVADILKNLLSDLDLSYQVQQEFQPREYCVQYRETDLAFASRLMEEEGIYYFFKHSPGGHQLVLADTPQAHPSIPYLPTAIWEDGMHVQFEVDRVFNWNKDQQIRSGKFTAWDYNFQIPDKHIEASKEILNSVMVGTVDHKLKVGGNDKLELYEFPGGYATKVDAVTKSGGDQSSILQHPFVENQYIAGVRMQQETVPGLQIRSDGGHAAFTAGHTFELTRHFSDNGKFVLTSVEHMGKQPLDVHNLAGGNPDAFEYSNSFTCIPIALPYRPPRVTPIPSLQGVQSAVVVGPPGEEIFPDKYGRVKVQFHWDREGKADANSSCWIRVATYWAGAQWGGVHIPRIGQEVLVDFIDGSLDRPIVVGSLYNPNTMPPWTLPDHKTISGTKSRSTPHGGADNFNELSFEDKKGKELVNFQAEKDLTSLIKNNESRTVGNDRTTIIKHDETKTVTNNESTTVDQGDQSILLNMGNQSTKIKMGNQSTLVDMGDQATKCTLGKIETEAMQSIELKVGQSSIKIDQMGVTIKGMMITVDAQVQAQVKSMITQVSGNAMVMVQGGIVMIN
jgi:type VI secretion system secreted protein VgrG